jgi:hypothetical protein
MARQVWSEAEVALLRSLYPSHPTTELARKLKRTVSKVYQKADKEGLEKSDEYLRDPKNRCGFSKGSKAGEAFRFPKGHAPANAGLRRPGWSPGRMRETQFQKGGRSGIAAKNWKPIGTIQPDAEGYLRIKVREAVHGKEATGFGNTKVWPLYNRYLWEQHKGPIPPKHIVIFKDRDRSNCVIENLDLMSMADNARRNSMWATMPRDLAEIIQLNGALKRKVRFLDGKKQNGRSA